MVDFPFLKGQENQALFIIGNGFDLYHDILSKYKHFYCWLNLNGYESLANDMQHIFDQLDEKKETLWSNFEQALGSYHLDKLYRHYYRTPNDSLGEDKWNIAANCVVEKVHDVCIRIRPLIKEWARQIKTYHVKERFDLPKNSFYLTFNYTKLLEDAYNIPWKNICHIHGKVDDEGELITGHDFAKELKANASSDEEEEAKKKIISEINQLEKNQSRQIERHKEFFESLSSVSHIVVLGHSLGNIDLRYFGEVLSSVPKDAMWHFSYHGESDIKRIEVFIKLTARKMRYEIFDL